MILPSTDNMTTTQSSTTPYMPIRPVAGATPEARLEELETRYNEMDHTSAQHTAERLDTISDRLAANESSTGKLTDITSSINDTVKVLVSYLSPQRAPIGHVHAADFSHTRQSSLAPMSPIPLSTPYTSSPARPVSTRTYSDIDKEQLLDDMIARMGDAYCSKITTASRHTGHTPREILRHHFFAIVNSSGGYGGFNTPGEWSAYVHATGVKSYPVTAKRPDYIPIAEPPFHLESPLPHPPVIPVPSSATPFKAAIRGYQPDSTLQFTMPMVPGLRVPSTPLSTPPIAAHDPVSSLADTFAESSGGTGTLTLIETLTPVKGTEPDSAEHPSHEPAPPSTSAAAPVPDVASSGAKNGGKGNGSPGDNRDGDHGNSGRRGPPSGGPHRGGGGPPSGGPHHGGGGPPDGGGPPNGGPGQHPSFPAPTFNGNQQTYNDEIKQSLSKNKLLKEMLGLATQKGLQSYTGDSKPGTIHEDFHVYQKGLLQVVGMYDPLKNMLARAHQIQFVNIDTYTLHQYDFKVADVMLMWKVLWNTTGGNANRIVESCQPDLYQDGDGFLALLKLKNNAVPLTHATMQRMKQEISDLEFPHRSSPMDFINKLEQMINAYNNICSRDSIISISEKTAYLTGKIPKYPPWLTVWTTLNIPPAGWPPGTIYTPDYEESKKHIISFFDNCKEQIRRSGRNHAGLAAIDEDECTDDTNSEDNDGDNEDSLASADSNEENDDLADSLADDIAAAVQGVFASQTYSNRGPTSSFRTYQDKRKIQQQQDTSSSPISPSKPRDTMPGRPPPKRPGARFLRAAKSKQTQHVKTKAKNFDVCNKCQGHGHYSNECPSLQAWSAQPAVSAVDTTPDNDKNERAAAAINSDTTPTSGNAICSKSSMFASIWEYHQSDRDTPSHWSELCPDMVVELEPPETSLMDHTPEAHACEHNEHHEFMKDDSECVDVSINHVCSSILGLFTRYCCWPSPQYSLISHVPVTLHDCQSPSTDPPYEIYLSSSTCDFIQNCWDQDFALS